MVCNIETKISTIKFITTLHYNTTNNNIIAGIATTSIETVLDPTKHWLDLLMGIWFKMSWIVISNSSRISTFLWVFLDKSGLISAQKLSMGFRSGLLAQCMDVMLCLPFFENSNFGGTKDSWLHVAVPWMPWLKNSIMAYKRLSTSLGSKTLNNTSSLGLGGTKI